jgi:VIT1/CCC1 family predicted Fe2+/Mn2+ transporter
MNATETTLKSSKRVLDPNDRIAEVLFGLIMVLTFTGSLSVAESGREDVRTMLIGALGCNIAWGIIDGVLYLMGCLAEKGAQLSTLQSVRSARDPETAHRAIADAVPPALASVLKTADLEMLRQRLNELPEPPDKPRLRASDWWGSVAVFLLVFLSTFPVTVPFIFMQNAHAALRTSNIIAMVMLFVLGVTYGKLVGRSAWVAGIAMIILGAILVALTMALGG